MADKKKPSKRQTAKKPTSSSATKVTIKKAAEIKPDRPVAKKVAAKPVKKSASNTQKRRVRAPRFLAAIGAYFKGAWFELRQVRWPDRKATWGLTLAVILFSLFFAALILGLDYVFQLLFKKILL